MLTSGTPEQAATLQDFFLQNEIAGSIVYARQGRKWKRSMRFIAYLSGTTKLRAACAPRL